MPLLVRPGTSDLQVFEEIFWLQVYRLHALWKILPDYDAKFIADCGAYAGYSSVYFSRRFPQATIWAIEPEPENYALLQSNVQGFSNIQPMQRALWHQESQVHVQNPDAEKWGFEFTESARQRQGSAVDTITVQEILSAAGDWIDILKIDIEGAEYEIFSSECDWLDRVGILIVELHDGVRPGCSRALFKHLIDREFCLINQHENVVLVNETLLRDFRASQSRRPS